MKRTAILLLAASFALGACARNLDSSTYTSGSVVGKVVYGTVISARQVTVKDQDKLGNNGAGVLAGGVAGGFAGNSFGKGTGRGVSTVGGAVGGALLGALIQNQLSTSTGTEYIVQLDSHAPKTHAAKQRRDYRISGASSVSNDINESIQVGDTEASAIAVVQQDQMVIAPGTRVAVIYSDDRPRITPLR